MSEFERIGWGAIPNGFHDLGTDLVLMPRDPQLFDAGIFMGAQVKSSANSDSGSKPRSTEE